MIVIAGWACVAKGAVITDPNSPIAEITEEPASEDASEIGSGISGAVTIVHSSELGMNRDDNGSFVSSFTTGLELPSGISVFESYAPKVGLQNGGRGSDGAVTLDLSFRGSGASVRPICDGIISFTADNQLTTGSISSSDSTPAGYNIGSGVPSVTAPLDYFKSDDADRTTTVDTVLAFGAVLEGAEGAGAIIVLSAVPLWILCLAGLLAVDHPSVRSRRQAI
jgi:hypothetical protein